MLKPTANYRMSKALKTSLALGKFKDEHQKGAWKRAMVLAEIAASIKPKADKGRKKETSE
jgi:hypothetical protein